MLSDNIRNYRKENNLSQDELAEKLGVSRQSISLWENGQTQPTVDNIIALAKIFNITADELLESYEGARISQEAPVAPKKRNGVLIAVISVITAERDPSCSSLRTVMPKIKRQARRRAIPPRRHPLRQR